MRALILAQGDGRRWVGEHLGPPADPSAPFLGVPKHLVPNPWNGETLLGRVVRQFREAGCEPWVVGPHDARYYVAAGDVDYSALPDPWPLGDDNMSKFVATADLWSNVDRTAILWGDCYYTDEAVRAIVSHPSDYLHYFRRPAASKTTGHRWDESFAVTFGPHEHARVYDLAMRVHDAFQRQPWRSTHICTHYGASLGLPEEQWNTPKFLKSTPGQTAIDDWTDDLDTPAEYVQWFGRRLAQHEDERPRAVVCIPWAGGDEDRTKSFEYVTAYYRSLGAVMAAGGDGGTGWVNRARCRNNAAEAAMRTYDPDVLFFADADTFVPPEQFYAACHAAAFTGQGILAFGDYYKVSKPESRRTKASRLGYRPATSGLSPRSWHSSGAFAITPAAFQRVGGYDERFESWGGEDRAFWLACRTLLATDLPALNGVHRLPGPAWHLWHELSPERDKEHPGFLAMRELGQRYKVASGWLRGGGILGKLADEDTLPDVAALLDLMAEPGGPLVGRPVHS